MVDSIDRVHTCRRNHERYLAIEERGHTHEEQQNTGNVQPQLDTISVLSPIERNNSIVT